MHPCAPRPPRDAPATGRAAQGRELFRGGVGIEFELEPDALEADRHVFGHPKRSAKIQVALGTHRTAPQIHAYGGGDCRHRDAGARCQRFQQHVSRASERARAAGRRMQARLDQRLAGLDTARDSLANSALRLKRDERSIRLRSISV